MTIQTIPQRKAAAAAAKAAAVEALVPLLSARAAALGGRYLLFGSAARGAMTGTSDVDLLLDFPDEALTRAAWDFAEASCAGLGLAHDIRPVGWCDARFLAHVVPTARVLG